MNGILWGQADMESISIKNDSVICEFDIRFLDSLIKEKSSLMHQFDDMLLPEIILKSNSKSINISDGWTLVKLDSLNFQLRKHLDDFKDIYEPLTKYFTDQYYWNRPLSELPEDVEILNKMRPKMEIDPNGNQEFQLKGFQNARNVYLAGSFNNWVPDDIKMEKSANGWKITLDLSPGIYEYKFIVDEEWMDDPSNPLRLENQYFTFNSILLIGKEQVFSLPGQTNANKVYLAGSFNNWDPNSIPMVSTPDGWQTSVMLPPGKHFYKFVVDDNWITDPNNDLVQDDKGRNKNSVIIIN